MRGKRHRFRTKRFWVHAVGFTHAVKGALISRACVHVCNLGFPESHEFDLSFPILGFFSLPSVLHESTVALLGIPFGLGGKK